MTLDQHILSERVGLYSLLRALYSFPLTETLLATVAGLSVEPGSPLTNPLRQMQARLGQNGSFAKVMEALNVEMTRLLEGPGLTPAPPYASYYLHGRQLMGPAAQAVRQVYLEWQVAPDSEVNLPADHLALELGFLAHLAQLAAESGGEAGTMLAASRDFLRQHLWPWLPRFCAALATASADPFFSGLAQFTQAAIQSDLAWLEAVLNPVAVEATEVVSLN